MQNNSMKKTYVKLNENNKGFSLMELVVVIAIMAVVVAVVVPQFNRYVMVNRENACIANRQALMAIYERRVYDESKSLTGADLLTILDGTDLTTKDEAAQYMECPSGGSFSCSVTNGVAVIACSNADHDDVRTEFTGWDGTDLGETAVDPTIEEP